MQVTDINHPSQITALRLGISVAAAAFLTVTEFITKRCFCMRLCGEVDRSRWRKQIGMIDDHDEYEWVNVSSGTGSPGLSRTNSTEP